MTAWRERDILRFIHLVLSIPILGYLYGPVEHIPQAAFFVRWIAMPIVLLSGLWMWLKPRIAKRILQSRMVGQASNRASPSAAMKTSP
jgi:hypothetical protein